MRWYAVRCCCQPQKIFGFLQLEDDKARHTIIDRNGHAHVADIRISSDITISSVGEVQHMDPAVYSDDREIEFWRTIPGFVEATVPIKDRPAPSDVYAFLQSFTNDDGSIPRDAVPSLARMLAARVK